MKLSEFTELLRCNPEKPFHLVLPGDNVAPVSFHITEVAHVTKKFIDCGGAVHMVQTCQLQAWLGPDNDHRLYAGKLGRVLEIAKSKGILTDDLDLDLEFEYEDVVISQYTVSTWEIANATVVLQLDLKHTDCLAKDHCLPSLPIADACCAPGCC